MLVYSQLLLLCSGVQKARKLKEIAQLKKDSRRKDNVIKTMEVEQKRCETVLKRKQEEVMNLR